MNILEYTESKLISFINLQNEVPIVRKRIRLITSLKIYGLAVDTIQLLIKHVDL